MTWLPLLALLAAATARAQSVDPTISACTERVRQDCIRQCGQAAPYVAVTPHELICVCSLERHIKYDAAWCAQR